MVCPAVLLQSLILSSLMPTGVQDDVTHIISSMCVVHQSTVLIPCKFIHPQHEQMSSVEWLHEKSPQEEVRVSQVPAFEGRVEFVRSDGGNCSLLLRDVRKSDAGIFRLVLNTASGQVRLNSKGIRLEVTDAEVEVQTESDVVTEGDWIVFTCGSCIPSMTVPTYTWSKDGRLLSQHHGENFLDLESVGLEDRGRYLCTISGHEGLNSTSVDITVRPGCVQNTGLFAAAGIGAALIAVCAIVAVIQILRKRATPSEERNHRASQHHKTVESHEDAYMTLDPKSRCSEYDTLDNMKRSCDTDDPEDQDSTYYNMVK